MKSPSIPVFAFVLVLAGCFVSMPGTVIRPIHDEDVHLLVEGTTSKDEVLQTLNEPDGKLAGDTIWVYIMAHIIEGRLESCAPNPAYPGQCILVSEGHEQIDVLEIVFTDAGVVGGWSRDTIRPDECTATGVCLIDRLFVLREDLEAEQ